MTSLMEPRYRLSKRIVDGLWMFFVKVKYPKFLLLLLFTDLAYWSFSLNSVQSSFDQLGGLGYISAFIGGMLFAFGFGAPFGVALLATIAGDVNIWVGGIIGGMGALLSDLLLFKFIRVTFIDEIEKFKNSKLLGMVDRAVAKALPQKIVFYLSAGLAGFVIASPLPDEIGVTLLAGISKVSDRAFALMSFSLNSLGILAILGVASLW